MLQRYMIGDRRDGCRSANIKQQRERVSVGEAFGAASITRAPCRHERAAVIVSGASLRSGNVFRAAVQHGGLVCGNTER